MGFNKKASIYLEHQTNKQRAMKSPLFLVIICSLLIIQISHSQPCTPAISGASMSINNIEAYFLNGGDMWWDFNSARYEVPAGSGKSPFFSNSLWLTGIDESDSLHCAAVRYRQVGNDYWCSTMAPTFSNRITMEQYPSIEL